MKPLRDDMRTVTLPIACLCLDFQSSECLLPDVVEQYLAELRAGKELAPIEVYADGQTLWLFDGFHRMTAAQILGQKDIVAHVRKGTHADMEAKFQEGLEAIRKSLRGEV